MSQQIDLSLPTHAPELLQHYPDASVSSAAFALYSLVPGMTEERLQEIADLIQRQYLADQQVDDDESDVVDLVRVVGVFGDDEISLFDLVAVHTDVDKEHDEDSGEVGLVDHAFLVVTSDNMADPHSLLLVYVDTSKGGVMLEYDDKGEVVEPEDEAGDADERGALDSFFVEPRFAQFVLAPVVTDTQQIWDGRLGLDVDADDYDAAQWEAQLEGDYE